MNLAEFLCENTWETIMKKRIISYLLIGTLFTGLISGCGAGSETAEPVENTTSQVTEEPSKESETEAVVAAEDDSVKELSVLDNGSPWVNSDLKENIHPDQPTDPKDDFHLYASMDWLSQAEIPDGYSGYTLYDQCADITKDKAIKMFNDGDFTDESHNVMLAKSLYDLYKDTDARNKEGVEPIREMVEKYLAVESLDDLNELFLDEYYELVYPTPIAFGVSTGIEDTSTNLCWVDGMSFILGDSAEYSKRTEYGDILYNYKKDNFVYVMGRLGVIEADANKRFDDAIAFETPIAKVSFTSEDEMSADFYDKVNNTFTYDEIIAGYKNYPIADIIDALSLKYDGTYMTSDLKKVKAIDEAYTEENADDFANLMLVKYVLGNISRLDEDVRINDVENYNKYFGVSGDLSLDERAYDFTASHLPEQTSQAFVERYSSKEDKERIEGVCYKAIDVYKEMLEENEWLSDDTKKAAIEKLNAITVHVGWPDKWNDYSDLDISNDSFYEAIQRIKYYNVKKAMAKLGTKEDKSNWAEGKNLLQCNASYDFTVNGITMMVGMMNEPFYWSDMSTEELYASIGAFWVGHEISHAFDSNGSQWDKDGNYANWWTDEDKAEFDKRVNSFIEYLNTIRIMGDYYVNGSNVDSEIVADTIGLRCALKMAEKEENFDYKKFFEFFSDMNSGATLYSSMLSQINTDPHPLNYLRVNVPVQQYEEFYKTYDVKEGDNMYLAPEKRLDLW